MLGAGPERGRPFRSLQPPLHSRGGTDRRKDIQRARVSGSGCGSTSGVVALLAFDLGILHREAREIRVAEAPWLSLFYVVLALTFAAGLFSFRGTQDGVEFLTGHLIEACQNSYTLATFLVQKCLHDSFIVSLAGKRCQG